MSRNWKRVGITLVLGAVVAGIMAWSSGPSFEGRSIRSWFRGDRLPDSAAEKAFRALGPRAVPFLVNHLNAGSSESVERGLSTVSQTLGSVYRQRVLGWQCRAAYLLGGMGSDGRAAESQLVLASRSPDWPLRVAATVALMKIREEPMDPLVQKLRDTSDPVAWYQNALMLAEFRAKAGPAVPLLLDAVRHTNGIIQSHALLVLGLIGQQAERCVPVLAPFLRDPSVGRRQKAMSALLMFGTNAMPAKAAIRDSMADSDPLVRSQAKQSLELLERASGAHSSRAP